MGDPIEKTPLVSVSYTDYTNEALGMSIAPAENTAYFSEANSSSDDADFFQAPLTLDTQVPVREGSRVRQIPIRGLLEEAGRGRSWALDALDSFLEERLASFESENEMCYVSSEDNIGPILTQLRSPEAVSRREAAKSLLGIILGQAPDALTSSDDLRRGLLVAAQKISEINQDRIFYEELAALDPQSRLQIRQLVQQGQIPSDPQLMQATRVRQTEGQDHLADSTPTEGTVAGGGGSTQGGTTATSAAEQNIALQTDHRSSAPTTYEGIIQSSLNKAFSDSAGGENFLSGPARNNVATRLQEILQTPGLSTAQISQTLYYAILGRAWNHPEFTSVENHYAELRPAARQVATDILQRLGLDRAPQAPTLTSGSPEMGHRELLASGQTSRRPSGGPTEGVGLRGPQIQSLLPGGVDGTVGALGTGLPTSSSVAAGMMGVNFFALAGRPVWQSLGFNGSDRPEYYVEGATAAEGESHHGSDSESGSQQDPSHQETTGGGENIFVA